LIATPAAIDIAAVSRTYPNGLRALERVDLRVQAGEFVTLLGPSGCGKSTLLRMIAGLVPPTSGAIRLQPADSGRAPLSYVFQAPTLMPWASVARNVRLPLELAGMAEPEIERPVREALALVGLTDVAAFYPRELSGGMQMRVSIARALVNDAPLLLMDEPFGALDEITRGRLDQEMRALWARRALTVLFVTHSVTEAVFLSTRVVVMAPRPGRIVGEVSIDAPHPRADGFRLTPSFAAHCARLTELLALGGEGEEGLAA
jgi:NitT/TauT family transport system ATP-binding protein